MLCVFCFHRTALHALLLYIKAMAFWVGNVHLIKAHHIKHIMYHSIFTVYIMNDNLEIVFIMKLVSDEIISSNSNGHRYSRLRCTLGDMCSNHFFSNHWLWLSTQSVSYSFNKTSRTWSWFRLSPNQDYQDFWNLVQCCVFVGCKPSLQLHHISPLLV